MHPKYAISGKKKKGLTLENMTNKKKTQSTKLSELLVYT